MSNSPNISDYDYFESLVPEEEKELQKNEKLAKDFLDMIDIQRTQFVAKQRYECMTTEGFLKGSSVAEEKRKSQKKNEKRKVAKKKKWQQQNVSG